MARNEHFMENCKGSPRQFLALVGDCDGMVRKQLNRRLRPVGGEQDCYFIETYYYSAKYGIKTFERISDLSTNCESSEGHIMCLFIVYKSMEQLKEAKQVADKIKSDMRVIIIDSPEVCPEAEQVETYATGNEFEIVYMNPNEQQLIDASHLSEKVGIERLLETMEVCNWPWRVVNALPKGTLSSFLEDGSADTTEHNINDKDVISGTTAEWSPEQGLRQFHQLLAVAEQLMRNYVQWFTKNPEARYPAPQHAELIHVSPDSPTTTEENTNTDDVSISVDIDLVCAKRQEEIRVNGKSEKKTSTSESAKKAEEKTV